MTSGVHAVSIRTTSATSRLCLLRFIYYILQSQLQSKKHKHEYAMASATKTLTLLLTIVLCFFIGCEAIKCYQCSSDTDPDGQDMCGAYNKFDKYKSTAIECSHHDSKTPGTFCVKITKQSPRGFIWDGRWRQVIRRCASVTSTGVTGVCNWGVEENGDYWEECSCSDDACNGASSLLATSTIFVATFGLVFSIFLWT